MIKRFCNACGKEEVRFSDVKIEIGGITATIDLCEDCAKKICNGSEAEALFTKAASIRKPRQKKVPIQKDGASSDAVQIHTPVRTTKGIRRVHANLRALHLPTEEEEKVLDIVGKATDAEIGYKMLLEMEFGKEKGIDLIWENTKQAFQDMKRTLQADSKKK